MFQAKYVRLVRTGLPLGELHDVIRADAERLAGGANDLGQRSLVYQHIFRDSGALFHFALVAAHGALWATWYLRAARLVAQVLAIADPTCTLPRGERMAAYTAFVDALAQINRQVMIEAFTCFYLYRACGEPACAELGLTPALGEHFSARFGHGASTLVPSPASDREFYETFFRWEQEKVVGPAVEAALAAFNWPLMKALSRRPWVWFSYFRIGRALVFRDFADREERVQKGLAAFDRAAARGWETIARNGWRNPFLPRTVRGWDLQESSRAADTDG